MQKISIAMPAYNASKYIEAAIRSITVQTYTNWELIVCDDCSTDNTANIVKSFQDKYPNIRLIKRDCKSGSARLPRFDAILAAEGDFVCPIDADDTIEPEYLEKLIKRQKETCTDIVLGRMLRCNSSLVPNGITIPVHSYDISVILSGKEACRETIGEWKIGLNGLLSKTKLYKNYIEANYYDKKYNSTFLDELDQRRLLMSAKTISLADSQYYYRQHIESVVNSIQIDSYRSLRTSKDLLLYTISVFSGEKNILQKMYDDYFEKIYRAEQRFRLHNNTYSKKEKKEINLLIQSHYKVIKTYNIRFSTYKYKILSKSFLLFRLYIGVICIMVKLKV